MAIAFSAILFRYADVSPSTGAFFRCVYALPPLVLLGWLEDRRLGPRSRRARGFALLAGAFFAADLVLWHHSIEAVGAGLATVLGNTQVLMVGLLFDATLASAVGCLVIGLVVGDLDLLPGAEAQLWLVVLALSAQVLGWLLIAVSLPRIPAVASSLLLML